MPQYFSPVGNDQIFDANGDPLVGGQIETYLAQSSTPAATYTSLSGVTPQSNPIILNSLGYPTLGAIWLTGGIGYKFIIKDSLGATLRTIDNIVGIGDTSVSLSEWVESGLVPTYINGTSFSVPGDQTPTLQINRRLRTTNTSGLIYSTITNSVFAAGITTVTLSNDSGTLDAGLSLVAYGLLSATNRSFPAVTTSGLADNSVTTAKIVDEAVTFAKFQNVSTMTMPGRTTAGSGPMRELSVTEVMGNFVTSATSTDPGKIRIATQAEQESASSTSLAVSPGRQQYHPSAAKGWVYALTDGTGNASYNVSSLTDAGTGSVIVNWATSFSSANYVPLVTVLAGATLFACRTSAITASSVTTRAYTVTGVDTDPLATFVVAYGDQ